VSGARNNARQSGRLHVLLAAGNRTPLSASVGRQRGGALVVGSHPTVGFTGRKPDAPASIAPLPGGRDGLARWMAARPGPRAALNPPRGPMARAKPTPTPAPEPKLPVACGPPPEIRADAFVLNFFQNHFAVISGEFRHLNDRLRAMEKKIVGQISDKLAETEAALDAAIGRVQTDVDALNAKVADLQAKVDAGTASPEDVATLDRIKAKLDALDPTSEATLPDTGGDTGDNARRRPDLTIPPEPGAAGEGRPHPAPDGPDRHGRA
jgi:outer membrane murein-binding lipoprotein Lpp